MGNILQSCWKALPTNGWRGVTHPWVNILSNSHDHKDVTNFRTGRHPLQHWFRYRPCEKPVTSPFSHVVQGDTTARSPQRPGSHGNHTFPTASPSHPIPSRLTWIWVGQFIRALNLTWTVYTASVRLPFSAPPCNQLPSPLETTPHHHQETYVCHLSRSFGFDRTHWTKPCPRSTGSGPKPPTAATNTFRTIDVP